MSKTKFIVGALPAFVIGGALIYTLIQKPQAPDSTFTTLKGEKISLNDLRGKVVHRPARRPGSTLPRRAGG